VIGEEVAVEPHLVRRHVELAAKEIREECKQLRVGVRDFERVASFRPLRPIQHAACCVRGSTFAGKTPAFVLVGPTYVARGRGLSSSSTSAPTFAALVERSPLGRRDTDVANPHARG
jgi:hypothetical protein